MTSWRVRGATPAALLAVSLAVLAGCGGGGGAGSPPSTAPTQPPASVPATQLPAPVPIIDAPAAPNAPATPILLSCDDSLKTSFAPDAHTKVLLVKSFPKGAPLLLAGAPTAAAPVAQNDLCLVKLNVGPGNPGPPDAPSTSPGIGIEVWLPSAANWNERIHINGGSGWAGGRQGSVTELANPASAAGSPAATAGIEGAVSASTDTGHGVENGSFAMNPDGTINTVLWKDYAERAVHEMAIKTKALTRAYYGRNAKYTYFNGFSTGGREGLKEAQAYPDDFDGILAGAPAINRTKLVTGQLYPQIVMQRELNGVTLTAGQHMLVSNAA